MRTALWETSPGALGSMLNAKSPLNKADLYTLTLAGGTVYRWTGSDVALTGGGHTWGIGPGLQRTDVKFFVGVQVDTLTLTITDNIGTIINGQALIPFIRAGGLQGARLQLDRAFWGPADTAPVGALYWFSGRVADIDCDRYGAQVRVKSDLELLDVMVPRDLYQAGCLNTLYDSACGVLRAAYTVSGAVETAPDARRVYFLHNITVGADAYFDLGVMTFTSGANTGISRTVKSYSAKILPGGLYPGGRTGALFALKPWPFAVAVGDAFSVSPGCNKKQDTCSTTFSNIVRFRGMPYIPVPETIA